MVSVIREDAKDTAVKIRRRLKREYPELPGNHFKVRSSVFSGGDSVTVSWDNYPYRGEVDKILEDYQSSSFDGMTDMGTIHGYTDPEDGKRYSGAKYVSTSYSMTDDWYDKVWQNKVNLRHYKGDLAVKDLNVKEYILGEIESRKDRGQHWEDALVKLKEVGYIEDVKVLGELKDEIQKDLHKDGRGTEEDVRLSALRYLVYLEEEYEIGKGTVTYKALDDVIKNMGPDGELKTEYNPKKYDGKSVLKDTELIKDVLKESVHKIIKETTLNQYGITVIEASMYAEIAVPHINSVFTKVDKEFLLGVEKEVMASKSQEMVIELRKAAENAVHLADFKKWVASIWEVREEVIKGVQKLNQKYRGYIEDCYVKEGKNAYERLKKESVLKEGRSVVLGDAYAAINKGSGLFKYIIENIDSNAQDYKKEIKRYIGEIEKEYHIKIKDENKRGEKGNMSVFREEDAVIREYKNKAEIADDVLTQLLKGEVLIVFDKMDGTERTMRATRSLKELNTDKGIGQLKSQVVEWNTVKEIRKEIEKGTISVVDLDKKAPRKFVLDRLKYFTRGSELVRVEKVVEVGEDLSAYYDPTKLKTEQMLDILSKKVVRLVFKKRDGSLRPMMATRNSELVELYQNVTEGVNKKPVKTEEESAEAIQRQIERDYVSVFDLTEGEFRSFKPSMLERYDSDLSISSWMEFTVSNDAWYDIARNGADAKQYFQEGKRGAKSIGRSLTEREGFEEGRKEYIEDMRLHRKMLEERKEYASKARREADIKKDRRTKLREVVNKVVKEYSVQSYSKKDMDIYKELVKVPDVLSNNIAFNNMDNEITQVKNMDKYLLVALQVRQDVFYMHPTFIVNVYSGRVYMDNTEEQVFADIGKVYESDADWGSEDVLKDVAAKIGTGRKKKSMFNQDEGTLIRVQRINTLAETHRMSFSGYGMNIGTRTSTDGTTEMLGVSYKGKNYLIHPDVVIQVGENNGKVLFKVERTTSRVREFAEFFNKWARSFQDEKDKKVVSELGKMILHGLDLRKTVKEVS